MNNTYQQSIDSVCEQPIEFNVKRNKDYKGKMIDKLSFRPITTYTFIKLQPIITSISDLDELLDDEKLEANMLSNDIKFLGKQLDIIGKNMNKIIKVLCLSYWNKQSDYPIWYDDFFTGNFSPKEIYVILRAIVSRLNAKSFMNSTILVKKGMGLITEKEIIASSIQCS